MTHSQNYPVEQAIYFMRRSQRSQQFRAFSVNETDHILSRLQHSPTSSSSQNHQRLENGLPYEEVLRKRARDFIRKLSRDKAKHNGYFLLKKHQEEEKRLHRQEGVMRQQEVSRWQKKSKILERIYSKQLQREELFAQQQHRLEQNKKSRYAEGEKDGNESRPARAKRFKTVQDETAELPSVEGRKERILSQVKQSLKSRKQKMFYLSNDDRLMLKDIDSKMDRLKSLEQQGH